MPLGVALPEQLDGEEHDRVFVVDPDSKVEEQASSDEDFPSLRLRREFCDMNCLGGKEKSNR